MARDLHNNVSPAPAINPQAISSDTATNGAIIDRQGFESLEFLIQSATLTDGTYTPSLLAGNAVDDPANPTSITDGEAVAASDLLGTIADATFAASDDNVVKRIGYRGEKRYVRLTLTSAGTTSGGTIGATAVRGHPRHAPAS